MSKMGLGAKIISMVVLLVLLTMGTSVFLAYRSAARSMEQSEGARLQGIAATGALMLNGDLHDKIRKDEDSKTANFKVLRDVLRRIKKANGLETDVYTLRQISADRDLKFVVMSNQKPFVGDTYKIPAVVKGAFGKAQNQNKASYTRIYRSANGWWISAYAPIINTKGALSGVLSVDTKLTTFEARLRSKLIPLLLINVLILVLGVLAAFFFSSRLVRRLKKLTELTEQMSMGKNTEAIPISSTDEVGQLARALNRMWESLRRALAALDSDDDDDDF